MGELFLSIFLVNFCYFLEEGVEEFVDVVS